MCAGYGQTGAGYKEDNWCSRAEETMERQLPSISFCSYKPQQDWPWRMPGSSLVIDSEQPMQTLILHPPAQGRTPDSGLLSSSVGAGVGREAMGAPPPSYHEAWGTGAAPSTASSRHRSDRCRGSWHPSP